MKPYSARIVLLGLGGCWVAGNVLFAQDGGETKVDPGHTAWMLASCALVLFMTPGLALFYGGLVRSKNVLSTMMHSFFCMALISVVWFMFGGGIVFGDTAGGYFGIPGKWAFLNGVEYGEASGSIPAYVEFSFQMMFAIITPALISGAFAERLKFSAFAIFTALWLIIVYCPLAHWVWYGGLLSDSADSWLTKMGLPHALDFAGGTVVHISSGITALVFCIILGKRSGYGEQPMPPHNLPLCVFGAGVLWFGWFGFNGGSGLESNQLAGSAFYVTHLCAATTALAWAVIERVHRGKASLLGVATGLVAGLVCITPASGWVDPMGAFIMGIAAAVVCYLFVAVIKEKCGYDDSLDVFGVHGIGGTVGALLTGLFCTGRGAEASAVQFAAQAVSVIITMVYAGGVTAILLIILDKTIGIRAAEDDETQGMDLSDHGERGYSL